MKNSRRRKGRRSPAFNVAALAEVLAQHAADKLVRAPGHPLLGCDPKSAKVLKVARQMVKTAFIALWWDRINLSSHFDAP